MPKKEQLTPLIPQNAVGLFRRLGAIFYDTLLIASLIFIVAQWSLFISEEAKPHWLFQIAMLLNIFGVAFLYLAGFWVRGGQTVGMKAWRIMLISTQDAQANDAIADGSIVYVSWQQAFMRYGTALLSWGLLGLGFLWSLFHPQKLAWHDIQSQSQLIRVAKS